MIRHALAATVLLAATPLAAQSTTQEEIAARYDRALAAGYKALFLCSAIANAERAGGKRTPESVMAWELTGIQAPLDDMVPQLPYEIIRSEGGTISHVSVTWDTDAEPRHARYDNNRGCSALPLGASEPQIERFLETNKIMVVHTSHPLVRGPLHDVGEAAFDGQSYGKGTRTTSVIVRSQGRDLVSSSVDDFPNVVATPQRTWSVAKSIAATLVGATVQRGVVSVDMSASLGAGASDPRGAITIDHLLRMASGRYSDTPGNRTDPLYFGGSTVEETALHWPLVHAPGTVYRYANNDTLAAIKAIEGTFEQHPPADFFAAVGMNDTVAETDWRGDYILSSQVWSTARDLAKLGQLYLDDGILPNGTRILPEGWVEYVSSPSGPQPDGPFGYGAGFWLLNKSEGVPPDTFAAMGNRGQFIIIVRSMNVVIVRRGEDPAGSRFDIAAFTRDVLESLDK